MNGVPWSPEDTARLRELYPVSGSAVLSATFPQRTLSSIRQHARKIGLKRNGRAPWTAGERITLIGMYEEASRVELEAALPNHNYYAICHMASELGVRKFRQDAKRLPRNPVIRQLFRERIRRGLIRRTLAAKMKTHDSMLLKWELEKSDPRLSRIVAWAAALDMNIVLEPKQGIRQQATPMAIAYPTKERLMARSASVSARRVT